MAQKRLEWRSYAFWGEWHIKRLVFIINKREKGNFIIRVMNERSYLKTAKVDTQESCPFGLMNVFGSETIIYLSKAGESIEKDLELGS